MITRIAYALYSFKTGLYFTPEATSVGLASHEERLSADFTRAQLFLSPRAATRDLETIRGADHAEHYGPFHVIPVMLAPQAWIAHQLLPEDPIEAPEGSRLLWAAMTEEETWHPRRGRDMGHSTDFDLAALYDTRGKVPDGRLPCPVTATPVPGAVMPGA